MMTYRQLDERSSRVATALHAGGVGREERVAFLDKNSPEQFELFFGAAKLNAVPAPVNFRLAPPEVAYIVGDTGAKVFAVGEEFLPLADKVAADLPGVQIVVIGSGAGHPRWPSFDEWRDANPANDPSEPQAPGDVAYQLYSSGTTGQPKGVQLIQTNLTSGLLPGSARPRARIGVDGGHAALPHRRRWLGPRRLRRWRHQRLGP
jgi:long-chain acyl-CoA synthetase